MWFNRNFGWIARRVPADEDVHLVGSGIPPLAYDLDVLTIVLDLGGVAANSPVFGQERLALALELLGGESCFKQLSKSERPDEAEQVTEQHPFIGDAVHGKEIRGELKSRR